MKRFTGIFAFLIVLLTMPLGHATMILMEKGLGHENVFIAAIILGLVGLILLLIGVLTNNETKSTFLGLFAGLFVWAGWIEFAFVYYANRFGVEPLMFNGEIITKPEYLIMPSSIGFWAIFIINYFFGTKTGCHFFNWFQKKMKLSKQIEFKPVNKNKAVVTFTELILILWTFYLILLFAYDENFFGEKHIVTYIIAFASLFWSAILFVRLLKIKILAYSVRYAIPTVIIFWNFIEILGRWNFFMEIWIDPQKYWLEMSFIALVFLILIGILFLQKPKHV
jgi:hypothetical protein